MTTYKQVRPVTRRLTVALGGASLFWLLAPRASVAAQNASVVARNRALVQQLFDDGVNAGDEALVATLYASSPGSSSTENRDMPAPAGMPMALRDFRIAAPGIQATVDALVAETDLVAARIMWRGPHPPAGTHIEGQTMHLFRIEREQIIEQWSAGWDWLNKRGSD